MRAAPARVAALLLGVFALASRPAPAQDGGRDDVRFYRVHLRNGNFLDGHLVRQDASKVVLRMSVGEMIVRRDQIERIEFIKLRSLGEPARVVPKPAPIAAPAAPARPAEAPDRAHLDGDIVAPQPLHRGLDGPAPNEAEIPRSRAGDWPPRGSRAGPPDAR